MKYHVLGVGNALLDYQVEVPFSFLDEHGLKKGSMSLVDAGLQHKLLGEIEKKFGQKSVKQTSGGCAARSLRVMRDAANVSWMARGILRSTKRVTFWQASDVQPPP